MRVSQYLSCLVAVLFTENDDFAVGLHILIRKDNMFVKGSRGLKEKVPMKWAKWTVSNNLLRTIEGTMVLVCSFLLIIQSREAIELWLNFAGVTFVGCFDNVAFELAQHNYFGLGTWGLAQKVSRVRIEPQSSTKTKAGRSRIFGFSGIVSAILVVCSFVTLTFLVVVGQQNGEYSCKVVSLTVGETRFHCAWHLSGAYERNQ